jgi:hypothetical protein
MEMFLFVATHKKMILINLKLKNKISVGAFKYMQKLLKLHIVSRVFP